MGYSINLLLEFSLKYSMIFIFVDNIKVIYQSSYYWTGVKKYFNFEIDNEVFSLEVDIVSTP